MEKHPMGLVTGSHSQLVLSQGGRKADGKIRASGHGENLRQHVRTMGAMEG